MTRGSPADVIVPNAADPWVVFGAPKKGVFVRLNASARSFERLARDRYAAHEREVEVAVARTAHRIARARADRELRGRGKRAGVEPAARRPLVGRQRGIPDEVRPLGAEAGERVVVGRLRDRERHARLQRQDAGQRPVVHDRARARRSCWRPAIRPERQVPDRRGDEHVRDVAGRVVALERAG